MKKCKKIERIYRDESDLMFKIRFPKGKNIDSILDVVFLIKEKEHTIDRMENNEPRFFELTPFERWCIEEIEKATKQFRKRFF